MIEIYDKKTAYKDALINNGLYTLDKLVISAETTEDISGNYELSIELELQGDAPVQLYEMLQADNIIKVNDEGSEELFRIAQVNKGLDTIELYCRHITIADSLNLWLDNVKPTDLNGAAALQWLAARTVPECKILFSSNISNVSTADYVRKNLYEALFEGDNAFINRWGGEVKRTGYTVRIDARIGQDKTDVIKIKEALNLTEFNAKTNIDEVTTVIYPIGFDGITAPRVVSKLVNNYSMEFPAEIKYEDVKVRKVDESGQVTEEGFATEEEARAELKRRAEAEFNERHIDQLQFTCDIDYLDLNKFEEYKSLSQLQTANLGDYISVRVETFDLDIDARIVARKFDVLRGQRIENTLSTDGEIRKPEKIEDIIKDLVNKEVNAGEIKDLSGYIDSMIQQGFKNGYVIYDKNACYAVDRLPKEQAKNVVVLNKNGLGYSSTGIQGPYKYGFTIDGKLNADMITTGTLSGQYIKAGTIEADRLSVNAKKEITDGLATNSKIVELQANIDGVNLKVADVSKGVDKNKADIAALDIKADRIQSSVTNVSSDVSGVKNAFNNYKAQADKKFDSLTQAQNDFENELNGAFKDGIIDEAEAKIIKDRLNAMAIEKVRLDGEYDQLYQAKPIQGHAVQAQLKRYKDDLDAKYNNLVNAINEAIADGKISAYENNNVNTQTQTFKNFLAAYRQAYIIALNKVGELYSLEAEKNANSYTKSEITQTANSITQKITKVEKDLINKADISKVSSLEQNVDGFKLTVNKTINRANLVPFGIIRGTDNYNGWDIQKNSGLQWYRAGDFRGIRPQAYGNQERFLYSKAMNVQQLRHRVISLAIRAYAEWNTWGFQVYLIGSTDENWRYDWAFEAITTGSAGGMQTYKRENITIPSNIKYLWVRIDHEGTTSSSGGMLYIDWVNIVEGDTAFDTHGLINNTIAEGVTTVGRDGIRCDFEDGTFAEMGRNGFKYKHPSWEHPYQYITKVLKVSKKRNGYWHKFYLGDEFKGKQLDADFKLTHYIGAVDCNAYVETGQYGGALRTSFTEVRNWNSYEASIEARCCIQKITLKTEVFFGWDKATTDTHKGGIIGESAGDIILIAQM